ncbi:MAG: hypothetical protein CR982_01245, partial [Candidatus Cloacimonadota bacterium]
AAPNYNGTETITITVNDNNGKSIASDDVEIIVNSVNDAPTIELPDSFTFNEDGTLEEDLAQYVNDNDGDYLTLSASTNENIFVTFAGLVATFSAAPNYKLLLMMLKLLLTLLMILQLSHFLIASHLMKTEP